MNVKVLLNHANTFAETPPLLREMTQIVLKTSKKRREMHIKTIEKLQKFQEICIEKVQNLKRNFLWEP